MAERVTGIRESESHHWAQIEMARLIGVHDPRASYAAVLESESSVADPKTPSAREAPHQCALCIFDEGTWVRDSPLQSDLQNDGPLNP